jgi:hypothetical protein
MAAKHIFIALNLRLSPSQLLLRLSPSQLPVSDDSDLPVDTSGPGRRRKARLRLAAQAWARLGVAVRGGSGWPPAGPCQCGGSRRVRVAACERPVTVAGMMPA